MNSLYFISFNNYCRSDRSGCICALNTTTEHLQEKGYSDEDISYIQQFYIYANTTAGFSNTEACIDSDVTPVDQALYSIMGEL